MVQKQNKLVWLLILQGWAMLWVIIGHSPLYTCTDSFFDIVSHETAAWLERFAYSFHMPLFIMISGYLFHMTRVTRGGSLKSCMKDKLKRLGIPYMVFILIAYVVKALVPGEVQRTVSFTLEGFVNSFFYPFDGPLREMWFVASILIFFMGINLYRKVFETKYLPILVLILSFGMCFIPHGIVPTLFSLDKAVHYFIFFYTGMMIHNYSFDTALVRMKVLLFNLILFVLGFVFNITIISNLSGCLLFWGMAHLLENSTPNLFSTFREYTYQIFLIGIFVQIAVKIAYNMLFIPNTYILFFMICIMAGLYVPVMISRIVINGKVKYIRYIIGL